MSFYDIYIHIFYHIYIVRILNNIYTYFLRVLNNIYNLMTYFLTKQELIFD